MPTLYHGTTEDAAAALLAYGWQPNSWWSGANCGDPRYLYLTNGPENALWFAQEKGGDTVLEVDVEDGNLRVDPHDGAHDAVEDELAWSHGLPGSVVAFKPIPAARFRVRPAAPKPR